MDIKSPNIKALLFDFDGLILETEEPVFLAWQAIYDSFGLVLPFEMWATTIGSMDAAWDPRQDLTLKLTRELDWEKIQNQVRAKEMELILERTVLPGVVDYLQSARRMGLKTAVASSSSRSWVEGHLERLELLDFFDCTRTKDDVTFTKPDPELFLSAMQVLEVNPEQTLVFEDSPNGILAAKKAGAWCVAVPNRLTKGLSLELADLTLNSLSAISLEVLLEQLFIKNQ